MRSSFVSLAVLAVGLAAQGSVAQAGAADSPAPAACPGGGDPYETYACLDATLGDHVLERFFRYYRLEWGRDGAPSDPNAPPARRADWPATPQTTPPMPFTEWPYGGATAIGVTRPNSVDSPLMTAIANTPFGRALQDSHIQIYGWLNAGGNVSSNSVRGGNAPAAYLFNPNTVQLDQAVVYIERLPDTVQKDRVDWGFRIAPFFGTNYRYTTAYGLFSGQLLQRNATYGYDIPMAYGEVFIPQIAEGLLLRFGRYIALPDIEAQLAPNNYMYSHSMTYTFDNYTNTGLNGTLALTRNWFVQLGLSVGTDTMPWNMGQRVFNPFPNALYPGQTFKKDPGAQPTVSAGVRWTSDSGNDSVYAVANGINGGQWGYNNLQWFGLTYFHKFNAQWHIAFETYRMYQRGVANANNPAMAAAYAAGGMPQSQPFNGPGMAFCATAAQIACTASVQTYLAYLNYRPTTMDNVTLRLEFFDDRQGQRTGVKTRYVNTGLGWQHWFSPQLEIRPEVAVYWSLDGRAFNGNSNLGIAPNRSRAVIGSMDMILHF